MNITIAIVLVLILSTVPIARSATSIYPRIGALEYTAGVGTLLHCQSPLTCLNLRIGSWVKYEGIDFGSIGATNTIHFNYSKSTRFGGVIDFRLDSLTGETVRRFQPAYTGGRTKYEISSEVILGIEGVHDVFLVGSSSPSSAVTLSLAWVEFRNRMSHQIKSIVCGSIGNCVQGNFDYAHISEGHEVRCCSDTEKQGWVKHSWCDVWTKSDLPACHHAASFDSAVQICNDHGARLCTKAELDANCTKDSGCEQFRNFTWSSTQHQESDRHWLACGSSTGGCSGQETLSHDNEFHEVRCCSDTPISPGDVSNCPSLGIYGYSELFDGQCFHSETYKAAEMICTNFGGRLCNRTELHADCSNATICSNDPDFAWTSDTNETQNDPGSIYLPTHSIWLACGRMGNCPQGFLGHAEQDELHEVRCCSDTAISGMQKNSWCDVWGGSELPICYHANTFREAIGICNNAGARLCTKEELELGCTGGIGCFHDFDFVWSSTIYDAADDTGSPDPQHMIVCGASSTSCAGGTLLTNNDQDHRVRCCSDSSLPGWAKNNGCDVWGNSEIGGTCYGSKNYDEATLICKAHGARLCTKDELLNDCTRGTGCNFDHFYIWSSSVS